MQLNTRKKWTYVIAGLSALALAPIGAVLARPAKCIPENACVPGNAQPGCVPFTCKPELYCAFKIDLAEKMILYKTFVQNSPTTKRNPSEGIQYDGKLVKDALAQAKKENPKAKGAELANDAYGAFVALADAERSKQASKYKDCSSLGIMPNEALRGSWSGMGTDPDDCNVYGLIGKRPNQEKVTLDTVLDKSDGSCREFYDNDRGHESVHQGFCQGRRAGTEPAWSDVGSIIDEDIAAYRFSVQRAASDLERLSILCSADPDVDAVRKRAKDLIDKMAQYQQKKAGK
jgi:hypothetical protein